MASPPAIPSLHCYHHWPTQAFTARLVLHSLAYIMAHEGNNMIYSTQWAYPGWRQMAVATPYPPVPAPDCTGRCKDPIKLTCLQSNPGTPVGSSDLEHRNSCFIFFPHHWSLASIHIAHIGQANFPQFSIFIMLLYCSPHRQWLPTTYWSFKVIEYVPQSCPHLSFPGLSGADLNSLPPPHVRFCL